MKLKNKDCSIACKKYSENLQEENGYLFCELCGRSGQIKYDVHHIIYKSEAPGHKNLNDHRNLIVLGKYICGGCGCHDRLHEKKELRSGLIESRCLYELFPELEYLKK